MVQSQHTKSSWQNVPSGTNQTLESVHFTSPDDGWAVGHYSTVLHYENQNWELYPTGLGEYFDFYSVYFPEPTKGWAVGAGEVIGEPYGQIAHFNGTSWEWQFSKNFIAFLDVYFIDSFHGWAVGWTIATPPEPIYYFNGSQWTPIENPFGIDRFTAVYFEDLNHGWFLGHTALVQYFDDQFTLLYENPDGKFRDFFVKDSSNIWFVMGSGNEMLIYYYNGDSVTLQSSTSNGSVLPSISFSDNLEGYAVGDCSPNYGNSLRYFDGIWQVDSCFLGSTFYDIVAVDNIWWGVGAGGTIAYKYSDSTSSIHDSTPHTDGRFEIYPNPVRDHFNIISQEKSRVKFELYNLLGRQLKSGILYPGDNRVDISDFKWGLYFLCIDNREVFKIIKM